ncbi:MAG: DUF1015 domain-containing protein [Nitrospinae bacterium]|nr:DUF1015 domain-containing protein [Nitrospinota bacterium]
MIEVIPFRGLLYNPDITSTLDEVIAPPYDVISPDQQEALYKKNPHNVVRLILGKEFETDSDSDNRYTRSAKVFKDWISEGVLRKDDEPGFYLYSQEYEFEGEKFCRVGFFARVKTEDFSEGNICPHEFTLSKAKTDRTKLLNACHANFSPIFGLYSDPEGQIDSYLNKGTKSEPLSVIDDGKVLHKIWRLNNDNNNQIISDLIRDKKIYIADGHHRYETALAFAKENEETIPDSSHVMMFLTNMDSGSMSIFPIHRVVKSPTPFDREAFLKRVSEYFEVIPWNTEVNGPEIKSRLLEFGKDRITFCAYMGKDQTYTLIANDPRNILPLLDKDEPKDLQVLDVVQLHTIIFREILKIDTREKENQQFVAYKVNSEEAMERVDAGEYDIAFFMNPTPIDEVRRLAGMGIRLPQKATFFYPKLLSGLVINKFEK